MAGSPKRRLFRAMTWIWALGAAALLLAPSRALPGDDLPEAVTTVIELAVHVALFLGLAYVALRGYAPPADSRSSGGPSSRRASRRRLLAAILSYCLALELLQLWVPGRGFEVVDIAAGWIGAALGLARKD